MSGANGLRRHINPYRINDPGNILEVAENSSHPELEDARRVYKFEGYSFNSATELQKFFEAEGIDIRRMTIEPVMRRNYEHGKTLIIVNVVPKHKSRNDEALRKINRGL